MRGETPGVSLPTIPMHHKIVPVEVEHADDRSEGSADSRVRVKSPEFQPGTVSKSRLLSWVGHPSEINIVERKLTRDS